MGDGMDGRVTGNLGWRTVFSLVIWNYRTAWFRGIFHFYPGSRDSFFRKLWIICEFKDGSIGIVRHALVSRRDLDRKLSMTYGNETSSQNIILWEISIGSSKSRHPFHCHCSSKIQARMSPLKSRHHDEREWKLLRDVLFSKFSHYRFGHGWSRTWTRSNVDFFIAIAMSITIDHFT